MTLTFTNSIVVSRLLLLIFLANSFVFAQKKPIENSVRTKVNINTNWKYAPYNTQSLTRINSYTNWENIQLPHTWNNEDTVDAEPGYRRNTSWYKKTLTFKNITNNKRYALYFEGANITTNVYVNGVMAGNHIGGYLGFTIDITNLLKTGDNEVLVSVDNSYNPEIIPSQKSDFFIYGGITRDVWLLTTSKTHLKTYKITTPRVSAKQASLKINATITTSHKNSSVRLKAILKNPQGKKVASKTTIVANNQAIINFKNLKNPQLWDVKNPNLYTLDLVLLKNKKPIDKITENVGFRWFEFKDHGPFYLNGKRLLLRGTHRHEEHAGVGAAMSNKQHYADMKSIKEMGANFVRLAHYPQDPEVYKACDKLGILVWDEIPWCRGGIGNDNWKKNTKNQLTEMILQNYNHPSIIIWSLGNEMAWLPDFKDGGNPEKIKPFLTELNTLAHQLDPTRKTALRKYYEGSDIVDVFSPSIWSGWYSGSYKSYQKAIDLYKKEYKHFIHAEYGGSSHVGRHTENPITGEGLIKADGWEEQIVQTKAANIAQIGDWSENYIADLFDWHLRISETDPSFVGNIQWAFKDFGTPLRPENDIPYINQKGLVDRNGKPKDAYYVFKSYWSDQPFAYIESHTWTKRQGPKNTPRIISVYSNCKTVAFYHNGTLLGKKQKDISKFPASGLTWNISFTEGKNELKAIGYTKKGIKVTDSITVTYRYHKNDVANKLELSYTKLKNGNYLVTATAKDKDGFQCLDYENRVYFQCLSGGKTLKHQGTPTGSEVIKMANGNASIIVIPEKTNTPITMMVLSQKFKGTYLTITP